MEILLIVLAIFWPIDAHAYLDPGTGSMVIQSIIASIAGGLYLGKIYWKRISSFIKSLRKKKGH